MRPAEISYAHAAGLVPAARETGLHVASTELAVDVALLYLAAAATRWSEPRPRGAAPARAPGTALVASPARQFTHLPTRLVGAFLLGRAAVQLLVPRSGQFELYLMMAVGVGLGHVPRPVSHASPEPLVPTTQRVVAVVLWLVARAAGERMAPFATTRVQAAVVGAAVGLLCLQRVAGPAYRTWHALATPAAAVVVSLLVGIAADATWQQIA